MWYLRMFAWMLALLVYWLILYSVSCGWWRLASRCFGPGQRKDHSFFEPRCFWIGITFIVGFLQIWHLFLPVSKYTLSVVIVIGVAGCATALKHRIRASEAALKAKSPIVLILALVSIWLANTCIAYGDLYDCGLYHLPMIRWIQSENLPHGLALLHSRFAFNNTSFLLSAAVMQGPWQDWGTGIINGLLFLVVFAQGLFTLKKLHTGQCELSLQNFFLSSMPAILFWLMMIPRSAYNVNSTSTDITSSLLALGAIQMLFTRLDGESRPCTLLHWWGFILPAAAACTVKVSIAIWLATIFAVALICSKNLSRKFFLMRSLAKPVHVAIALILVPWLFRGWILSGNPVYPMPVTQFSGPSGLTAEEASDEVAVIRDWARHPGIRSDELQSSWYIHWMCSVTGMHIVLIDANAIMCLLLCPLVIRGIIQHPLNRDDWSFLVIIGASTAASLILWLVQAPDPRFVIAPLLSVPLLLGGIVVRSRSLSRIAVSILLRNALICSLILMFTSRAYFEFREGYPLKSSIAKSFCWPPPNDSGHWLPPVVRLVEFKTEGGLPLLFPETGDRVYSAPLLSVPAPSSHLKHLDSSREWVLGAERRVFRRPPDFTSNRSPI